MELSQIQQAWAERGFSCTVWTDPPGRSGRILSMRWMNWSHSSKGRLSCPSRDKRSVPILAKKCLFLLVRVTVRNIGAKTNRWCFGYKRKD